MNKIELNVGEVWHVDEQQIKINREWYYSWNVLDENRFLIANVITKGRSVFEKKVRYLYDSGKISKETYKKMIDYASIIDKLPVKRKYYENFFTR